MRVYWALCLSALSFPPFLRGSRGLAFWVVSFAAPESWHQIGTPFGRCFCLNIFTSCEVGRPLYLIRDWRARGGLKHTGERVPRSTRRRRPRDNLRRLIPSALRFVVLFSFLSCAAWEFSLVLSPSLAYLGFIWRTPRLFSAFSPLPSPSGEETCSLPIDNPPKRIVFAALWRPIFTPTGVFVSFYFLATVLLALFFAWLLGTSERIHLCFFSPLE